MSRRALQLEISGLRLAVCRLPPEHDLPVWGRTGPLWSMTRTGDELSVVVAEEHVPSDVSAERGWRALRVRGPLEFSEIGILSRLTAPLADAGVSVFAISTYDTDYLLVRAGQLGQAVEALERAGIEIIAPS